MTGLMKVDSIANSAGTGPVAFPFGFSGYTLPTTLPDANYTMTGAEGTTLVMTPSTARTITLPSAVSLNKQIVIVNLSASNTITIAAPNAATKTTLLNGYASLYAKSASPVAPSDFILADVQCGPVPFALTFLAVESLTPPTKGTNWTEKCFYTRTGSQINFYANGYQPDGTGGAAGSGAFYAVGLPNGLSFDTASMVPTSAGPTPWTAATGGAVFGNSNVIGTDHTTVGFCVMRGVNYVLLNVFIANTFVPTNWGATVNSFAGGPLQASIIFNAQIAGWALG